MLQNSMATRKNVEEKSIPCNMTGYQVYEASVEGVIDYTERRLGRLIENVSDPKHRQALVDVSTKYCSRSAAVAWRSGQPVWLLIK